MPLLIRAIIGKIESNNQVKPYYGVLNLEKCSSHLYSVEKLYFILHTEVPSNYTT